ncbi:hypothetical protein Hte_006452 [Hypoxylon texense]
MAVSAQGHIATGNQVSNDPAHDNDKQWRKVKSKLATIDVNIRDINSQLMTLTQTMSHFTTSEQGLLKDPKLIAKFQGIDNAHPGAPDIPKQKASPLELREFLSVLVFSYFPVTHRFGLFLRPIAYTNIDAKRSFGNDKRGVGNKKHIGHNEFDTIDGFVKYANDIFKNHNQTMVIGLAILADRNAAKAVVLHKID